MEPREWLSLFGRPWALYRPDGGDGGGSGSGSSGGTGGSGDGDAGGSGTSGTGSGDAGGSGGTGGTGDGKGADDAGERLKVVEAELKRARDEAAATRRELSELKRKGESDTERVERERREADERAGAAERELRELRLTTTVAALAPTLGIVDPEVAADLAAKRLASEDWKDGKPDRKAVERVLRDLAKEKPYLVRSGGGDGGAGNGNRNEDDLDMNARLRLAAGRGR